MGCDTVLEWGTVIPMSHEHSYSEDWKSDDTNHWHECSCKDRKDEAAHEFVLGTCSVCGKTSSSAAIDPDELTDALGSMLDTIIGAGSDLDFGNIDFGELGDIVGDIVSGSGNGDGSDGGDASDGSSDSNNGTGSDGNDNASGSDSGSASGNGSASGSDNGQTGSNGNSGSVSGSDTNSNSNSNAVNKDDNSVSPDTGSGYALGFVIFTMLLSTCALAVIRRKDSITA